MDFALLASALLIDPFQSVTKYMAVIGAQNEPDYERPQLGR